MVARRPAPRVRPRRGDLGRRGGRLAPDRVVGKPGGGRAPRWSPDGQRLAFLSRRRGWSQVWLIDAPVPRRGRPATEPKPPRPTVLTATGVDVDAFEWAPDGAPARGHGPARAGRSRRPPRSPSSTSRPATTRVVAGERQRRRRRPLACRDGSLLYVSDADGWFQVVRLTADGHDRIVLTSGEREHGEPSGGVGSAPLPSPDGSRFVHVEVHDGLAGPGRRRPRGGRAPPKRGRGRPPKTPRTVTAATAGSRINPWDGVWRSVGWLADGAWIAAIGESETGAAGPVAAAGAGRRRRTTRDRARSPTRCRPSCATPLSPGRASPAAERVVVTARDGLRIEGTLWRPNAATGKRGGTRVPTIVYPHGGPTCQSFRSFQPFKQLLVGEGFAFLDVDFRGSTGYGRAFRVANHDEWGHADVHDLVDAARWAAEQPWSDGRLAIYGGSYGGYLVLCALVEEPAMWRAGVDLYGDSEIAESYRHGDRLGRLDLHKMMGSPDDPARTDVYRRGSPVYRAERIEAPLLILHGRKDKRVVPLMTERMVEALEIEGKRYEVQWYDEEGHGWEKRENRRDAYERILAFLKANVLDEPPE